MPWRWFEEIPESGIGIGICGHHALISTSDSIWSLSVRDCGIVAVGRIGYRYPVRKRFFVIGNFLSSSSAV